MENKPKFDATLIIPIVFGIFSLFGICLVLLLANLANSRRSNTALETATPFTFILLGTEPGISTSIPDTEIPEDEVTPTRRATPTRPSTARPTLGTSTSKTESTSPPLVLATRTPTSSSAAPLNPGTYDDRDSRIAYSSAWIPQLGVSGAFQNSLHLSSALGSTISFRFIGQQVRVFYQSSPSLGEISIVIDSLEIELDQESAASSTSEWVSPVLINGTHTVVITHVSGGSVNLDYVIVPDVLQTPTVTTTP